MRLARLLLLVLIVLTLPKEWHIIKGADSHLFSKKLSSSSKLTDRAIERPLTETVRILAQPFSYWGKGSQFYVYLSADGSYVLKIPRASKQRESLLGRILRRDTKKPDLLKSLQIAYENLAIQTGLITVHFQKWDSVQLPPVILSDRLHRAQIVDLNVVPFALQKRQKLLSAALTDAADDDASKRILRAYLDLIRLETERGWMSHDCAFWLNFGIENDEARRLDVGSYVAVDKNFSLNKSTKPVAYWLKKNNPALAIWFEQEIEQRARL